MLRGTVKWFNNKKGFGFINGPGVEGDIFVHYSEIKTNGYRSLEQGEQVEFELVNDQKGSRARSVVKV
jgi:CspA family cold shock protein